MNILFIFKNENFIAPIGLMTISAVAKSEGHNTYLCETNQEDPLKKIEELKPDVIAYSSSSGEAKYYLKLNKIIKERYPDVFTIMGGPHPTFFPKVINESDLDAICVGEGESAFKDLLRALKEGVSIEAIPNILTKSSPEINLRPLIEDLDSIPFPDYGLFYNNSKIGNLPLKSFITSRGCPYYCIYCFNHSWRKLYQGLGKLVRKNSVDYVISNIKKVMENWPLSSVKFYDDIFCYSSDNWLDEFAKKYKENIGLPFFILTRADLLNEEMVKLLKYAGCQTISMSIEAGNSEIRNKLLKRNMSDEAIISAHLLCKKYEISTFTNCIVGLPDTKIKNDIESVGLAIRSGVTWAEFPIFYPYPGTELGDQVINMGYYTPDYEHMHTSYMHSSLLSCFNEKEKNAQKNLSVLGAVAVVFPKLRNLIVNFLIYFPHNKIFTFIYWLVKMHVLRKKIYTTKTTFLNSVKIFLRSLKQEFFRHTAEKL